MWIQDSVNHVTSRLSLVSDEVFIELQPTQPRFDEVSIELQPTWPPSGELSIELQKKKKKKKKKTYLFLQKL